MLGAHHIQSQRQKVCFSGHLLIPPLDLFYPAVIVVVTLHDVFALSAAPRRSLIFLVLALPMLMPWFDKVKTSDDGGDFYSSKK
jgi:hypothetical protein